MSSRKENPYFRASVIAIIVALALASSIGAAWVLMLLWNWAVATPFNYPKLGLWQTWGIMWILSIVGKLIMPSNSKK